MRPHLYRTSAAACLLVLLAGCTNHGLGSEATGRVIGQADRSQVRLVDPGRRDLRPTFRGEDLDGKPIDSGRFRGTVTVVNFWASWCAPCRVEQPVLERVWRRYRDAGSPVAFLGVDLRDTIVNAKAFVREYGVSYPSMFNPDSSVAARFRLRIPPSTFVLDRSGRVAVQIVGAIHDERDLAEAIDRVLAE